MDRAAHRANQDGKDERGPWRRQSRLLGRFRRGQQPRIVSIGDCLELLGRLIRIRPAEFVQARPVFSTTASALVTQLRHACPRAALPRDSPIAAPTAGEPRDRGNRRSTAGLSAV